MIDPVTATIIQDGAGSFWAVADAGANLDHVWLGLPVKRCGLALGAGGTYQAKARAKPRLIRRAGTSLIRHAMSPEGAA